MTSPYRGGGAKPDGAPVDDGIVGDLVRQFADRFAFYRELVQNSIDAGATRIDVRITETEQGIRASVRDDGEGMDPDTLQEKLLVLFRSGKEGQEGKIGKFGVGFVSVLAVEPERVTVQTSRGSGETWTLHLHRDHRYELFETGGGDDSGTTVILDVPVTSDEQAGFVKSSLKGLRRWCRHATVPIRFGAFEKKPEAINQPLVLDDALLQVARQEGDTRVVVGLPNAPGKTYAGFFNQGLTLHETTQPVARGLEGRSFKVLDSGLEHTLSRDNVRRDAAFKRVIALVKRCLERDLITKMHQELSEAAQEDVLRHQALLEHWDASLPLRHAMVSVPVLHGPPMTVGAMSGKVMYSVAESPLTRALSSAGHHVVYGLSEHVRGRLLLQRAESVATLIEPIAPTGSDTALLDALQTQLACHRRPSGVQFVRFYGATQGLFTGGPVKPEAWLHFGKLDSDPFRLVARPGLLLNASQSIVIEARRRAQTDPDVAATLLARALLAIHDRLDDKLDDELTMKALDEVLRA